MEAIDNAEYLVADWWQDPSNRLAVLALLIGSPLIIAAFRNHFWAKPALQVYIFTFVIVGFLWTVRQLRWRGHSVTTLMLLGILHFAFMTGLVIANYAVPDINRWPVMLYGVLAGLISAELSMFAGILAWLGKRCDPAQAESNKKVMN